ncbi:DUF3987 domain-containing protein, partial [Neobacillus drentensis]|uniref:DUF3987 domain-containing protein n=1 Tax=Neobacillus drentensis TaxID=220684 RepID=UPI002FFFC6D4
AIGNSAEILIDEGWIESALLWGCYVADPGSNKSGISSAGLFPLKEIQKRNYEVYQGLYEEYNDKIEEYHLNCQKKKASSEELIKPIEPTFNQIIVNDTTMEALSGVLECNPRGVIASFDELVNFMAQMDMYRGGAGADKGKWLSIFVRDSFPINRTSKRPKQIEKPFVSVHGNITPDNLNRIISKVQDGFSDRFLFVYPIKILPYYNPNEVDPKLQQLYAKVIELLLDLHNDVKNSLQVRYTSDAKTLWTIYHDYLVSMTERPDFPKRLEGVFSKFRGIFSRIVLIVHLTNYVCHETAKKEFVEKDTVEQAFKLVKYFIEHAKKVYNAVDRNEIDIKIEMVQEFINKRGDDYFDENVPDWRGKIITVNVMNHDRVFSPKYDSKVIFINEVLTEMQEQGLGLLMDFPSKGTKPIRKFLLFYHPINV